MEKLFKIVKDNKKSLRQKSSEVKLPISDEIKKLGSNMLEYLELSQDEEYCEAHHIRSGVGLAAPQIGRNIDLIAIYLYENENTIYSFVLANPKIIEESVQEVALKNGEGCLSVDNDHPGIIYRKNKIKVLAHDVMNDEEIEIEATGMLSIVLQHEIDHLIGVLFYDRINKMELSIKPNTILL